VASAAINFLAVGDWGGQDSSPYYTAGQKASVTGMNKVASAIKSQFVLALGDNFYSSGIPTKSSSSDPRFQTTFENVYTGDALQTPWYVVAGNHDHEGNVTAQIEYTTKSSRWTFPSEFYTKSFTSDDGVTLDIVMIDTIDITGSIPVPEGHPDYFAPLPEVPRSANEQAWTWLEEQLAASKADYLLVGGHYPVYSVCEHGPTATLVTNLKPLLEQYGAHYLSGHDHCMEHIVYNKVNYIITGMGEECCYDNSNLAKNPSGSVQWYVASNNKKSTYTAGFSSLTATTEGLTVSFYDQAGNLIYTTPSISPRSRR